MTFCINIGLVRDKPERDFKTQLRNSRNWFLKIRTQSGAGYLFVRLSFPDDHGETGWEAKTGSLGEGLNSDRLIDFYHHLR